MSKSTVLVSHPGLSQHAPRFGPGTLHLSSQPFSHGVAVVLDEVLVLVVVVVVVVLVVVVVVVVVVVGAVVTVVVVDVVVLVVVTVVVVGVVVALVVVVGLGIKQAPVFGSFSFLGSRMHSSNLSQTPSSSSSATA